MNGLQATFGGIVASAAGAFSTLALGVAGAIDPSTAISGLLVYGPLGTFAAWAMWRLSQQDKQHAETVKILMDKHAEEREKDRTQSRADQNDAQKTQREVVEHLGAIRALLEHRQ